MNTRKFISLFILFLLFSFSKTTLTLKGQTCSRSKIMSTMKKATQFMVEKVSYEGGYVWSYLPDMSRRWGEMEAYKSMIWIQSPGTPDMGHILLDAYHVTHDEYYYQAARKAAGALIKGQLPCGGWNYLADFAGDKSIKEWYSTIGANGWRLEEFQHYYGNATFDDGGTAEAETFLLRMYLERKDTAIKAALDKAIKFTLESQYPNGGWPQRYPHTDNFNKQGEPDYTGDITFNDEVAIKNIYFLILCYHTLDDTTLPGPIHKAMDAFVQSQMPGPQPGWALQYTPGLKPAGARTYEPVSLSTATTERNLFYLMLFYRLTGDTKFLKRIPEALNWLESTRLPDSIAKKWRDYAAFLEVGTNKPLYVHRRGSNVTNGVYYVDYNPDSTITHYHSMRHVQLNRLRNMYDSLKNIPPDKVTEGSILIPGNFDLPPVVFNLVSLVSNYNSYNDTRGNEQKKPIKKIIKGLNKEGYWPSVLKWQSNPYIGPGPEKVTPGYYGTTLVGDKYDTSPYRNNDSKIKGITTELYIRNMMRLMKYLTKLNEK